MPETPLSESRVPADQKKAADKTTAETEQEFISNVRNKLETWLRVSQDWRSEVQEDFEMTVGGKKQWRANDRTILEGEQRPVLTFNALHPTINFISGYQIDRWQDPRAFPRGSEDEALGRDATAFLKYAMDVAHGEYQFHMQFRKGSIGGLSVMEIGHSFERTDDIIEGDANLVVLPQNAWYCDPGAREYDRNDAWWQGKLMWMGIEEARNHPGWEGKAFSYSFTGLWDATGADPRTTGVPDQLLTEFFAKESQQIRVMQHWYRVPTKIVLVVDSATQTILPMKSEAEAEKFLKTLRDQAGAAIAARFQPTTSGEQAGLQNVETGEILPFATPEAADQQLKTIKLQAGQEISSKYRVLVRDRTALRVAHLTAWDLLDDGPSPYLDDWRMPFSPFIPFQDTDDLYAMKGVIRDLKDAQRELNWNHSTLQDELVRGPKSGWWLPKDMEAQVEDLKNRIHRSGFLGTYNSQPPQPVQPAIMSEGFMRLMQFDIDAVMRISGYNAELLGQTTQKTVSGRAIQARQAGGLVGASSMMLRWKLTQVYTFTLLMKRIQQFWSEQKMLRVLGQDQRIAQAMGIFGQTVEPAEQLVARFKRLKEIEFDLKVDFQEASPTGRQAVFNRLMQITAAGWPTPPEILLEAGDFPYKEEMKAALKAKGMQPPNEALAKVLGAGQGQGSSPDGVNKSA